MYSEFERRSSNAQLARREIDEQRPRHQAAKQAAETRAKMQQALLIYNLALPPGPTRVVLDRNRAEAHKCMQFTGVSNSHTTAPVLQLHFDIVL